MLDFQRIQSITDLVYQLRMELAGRPDSITLVRSLVKYVLRLSDIDYILNQKKPVALKELSKVQELLEKLQEGVPLAHIVGYKYFWKSKFTVSNAVLIPREDSEALISAVKQVYDLVDPTITNKTSNRLRILDLGTGSGCLLLSLLQEYPNGTGVGVDVSPECLKIATLNAENLGLLERSKFILWDIRADLSRQDNLTLQPSTALNAPHNIELAGKFNIIISNPPYIPLNDPSVEPSVTKFEPLEALYAGEDGLDFYKIIFLKAKLLLASGGIIAVEIGAGQKEAVEKIALASGFRLEFAAKDMCGHWRALVFKDDT